MCLISFALFLGCSIVFAGGPGDHSAPQASEILGQWVMSHQGQEYVYDFRPDGAFFFNNQQGQYSYSSGQLTTYLGGQTVTYTVQISGDTMRLTYGGPGGSTMELKRRSGTPGQQEQTQGGGLFGKPQTTTDGFGTQTQGLAGTWTATVNGQQVRLVLNPDGSGEFQSSGLNYTAAGNQLTVSIQGGTFSYNYQLSGNTLVLSGGDLPGPLSFTRAGGAAGGQQSTFGGGQTAAGQSPAFDTYTFQAASNVRIGYPRGWAVTEHQLGATITERQTTDTAGLEVLFIVLQQGINTKEAFADMMVDTLRQSYFSDLTVRNRSPHPQSQEFLVIDLSYTLSSIPYQGRAWCAVEGQSRTGMFVVFYAPASRYNSFSPDQLILGCLSPLLNAAQQSQRPLSSSEKTGTGDVPQVVNGAFSEVVFYSTTGSLFYYWYDVNTGNITHGQQGLILRPDGTYYLRAEFGSVLTEHEGRYSIRGNSVRIEFDDGSGITLTIEDNCKRLCWHDNGILLAEFFFVGFRQ